MSFCELLRNFVNGNWLLVYKSTNVPGIYEMWYRIPLGLEILFGKNVRNKSLSSKFEFSYVIVLYIAQDFLCFNENIKLP